MMMVLLLHLEDVGVWYRRRERETGLDGVRFACDLVRGESD